MRHIAATILMVKPVRFTLNEQTAVNNYFQDISESEGQSDSGIQAKAVQEFDSFVAKLREHKIEVLVFEDTREPHSPDSIFPNNWVTFHENGAVIVYPMFAKNRRVERRMDILKELSEKYGFEERIFLDFSVFEQEERFLEGTGSLVLDRKNRVAYAALSDRTDPGLVDHFCSETGYRAIKFHANQTVGDERLPIYHTNVMMSVGEKVAVICLGAIDNPEENRKVKKELLNSGKAIVEITEEQTAQYAGNMLEVENKDGDHHMVMSSSAYHSLRQDQIDLLERHCTIIHSEINTIETMGGGSARCMMAEIFLPKKD